MQLLLLQLLPPLPPPLLLLLVAGHSSGGRAGLPGGSHSASCTNLQSEGSQTVVWC